VSAPAFIQAEVRIPPAAREAGWWLLVLAAALATARLTLIDPQWGCTLALVVLTLGVYARSRRAGLAVVWVAWLLAPGVRRLFGLTGATSDADALSLAPFLLTAAIALLELRAGRLSRGAGRWLLVALAAYALGLPAGLASPEAALFGAFAYGTAVLAFAVGYREPPRAAPGLQRVLLIGGPLLAVYGVVQYVALPSWDETWLNTVDFVTAGAPEHGHVRVFSTLNSPGTFAMILALAALAYLALRRFSPPALAGLAAVLAGLALTYVRGAWGALLLAAIAMTLASRGRMAPRLALVAMLTVAGLAIAGAQGSTGAAIVARFDTFGSLGRDESTQTRLATPLSVVPQAAARPLGAGLGSAGEPSRLSTAGGFRYTDNAYLSLLFQLGPLGFALVIAAIAAGMRRAWRGVRASPRGADLVVFGLLVFILIAAWSGDLFYGVTGIAFWYLLGVAWRRDDHRRSYS
jgi:putative inorganic carbon (HCO3(-)) transporter